MLYRKKTLTQAIKWDGGSQTLYYIERMIGEENFLGMTDEGCIKIKTLEGDLCYPVGYYICLDAKDNPYGCDGDVFESMYEEYYPETDDY